MLRSSQRSPIPVFAGLAVVLCATLFLLRADPGGLKGDEGTYVAMAASAARDFDLRFDEADRAWAAGHPGGPATLILERTGRGISYSKPVLYPLLAAPFVALAGDWGAALFNLLVLLAALVLARAFLERLGEATAARDTLLTFIGSGIVVSYVAWRMTETLQLALALSGLVLSLATLGQGSPGWLGSRDPTARERPGWAERLLRSPSADLLGGLLLGLLISLREPNAAVALAPVLAAVLSRDLRRAARIGGAVVLSYLAALALTWVLTGAMHPYKATRASFNAETGYPVGEASASAVARFDRPDQLATSSLALTPVFDAGRTLYASFYFLVGRHTGLAIFLPAALFFAVLALRQRQPAGLAGLASFSGLALFYLVWMPANFFGGETFLGNRYILAAYPCLLVALPRLPSRRTLLVIWALAGVVGGSALLSELRFGKLDPTSQGHVHAGIFRLLPYESTASNLDGRRDRYWAGDFVRFVDPFAVAERWSFTLHSDRPAAELEVATGFPAAPMHFVVVADTFPATLAISDWQGTRRYLLASSAAGRAGGRIEHSPAPAWRRHRFWWSPVERYDVRLLRFALETPGAKRATMRVRYLGGAAPPEEGFGRAVAPIDLPEEVVAGSRTTLALQVRNTGTRTWSSAAVTPVQIGARIVAVGMGRGEAGPPIESRFALPRAVAPGETLDIEVVVAWPPAPGRYRVTVDLVLEDLFWFADKVGEALATGEVEVRGP